MDCRTCRLDEIGQENGGDGLVVGGPGRGAELEGTDRAVTRIGQAVERIDGIRGSP